MNKQNEVLSHETLSIQPKLRRDLTPVLRNRDHRRLVEDLKKLDEDLRSSGVESLAMRLACETSPDSGASFARLSRRCEFAVYALRAELLRQMLGAPAFVPYSVTLSTSDLLADFCGCRTIDGIRWTSKSTLQRASTFFDQAQLEIHGAVVDLPLLPGFALHPVDALELVDLQILHKAVNAVVGALETQCVQVRVDPFDTQT